ncbi:hypothetical protein KDH_28150 [Dictyobacter sp. S3.2.2.5]|uniref:Glycosyl transferase family 1 domain-containing protein n=2 Tax=Dictyobacter halimunensis TaxID=3026934 RepID=A0ABQ6FT34_9CHLR|nr:hypothetical protein KDH_28150 [Dictyobacter sp. S3.2.2.5]
MQAIKRVVRTFEYDILDGGVSAPPGVDGICFEEVAVYPAAHHLTGFLCGLIALQDYVIATRNGRIELLVQCAHMTLHRLCAEFDTGYWTRAHLLQYDLASTEQHLLQERLLHSFSSSAGCMECARRAERWAGYAVSPLARLRASLRSRQLDFQRMLLKYMRAALFPKSTTEVVRIVIPITAFPLSGGMRAIITDADRILRKDWQIAYLTNFVGANSGEYIIYRFGKAWTHPWQFPAVWFYCLAGGMKLFSLLRQDAGYQLLLPQDGVFSSAFTTIVGKLAGVRVVVMDHGNMTWLENPVFRAERLRQPEMESASRLKRWRAHIQFQCYWFSLLLLARITACLADHFFIPGVDGDEETDVCRYLHIEPSRVTRYASMIDPGQYHLLTEDEKGQKRRRYGIDPEAIVIVQICRLAPEKGIEVSLEAFDSLFAALPPERKTRVQFILGGDGPLRQHLERQVQQRGLSGSLTFWGDLSRQKAIDLLSLSNISLYSSLRGVGMPLSILEAMASGCAVIATPEPLANVTLLADGRGIVVNAGDAPQTGRALMRLVNDAILCQSMGKAARDYVIHHNHPIQFGRALARVTGCSSLDALKGESTIW